MPLFDALSKKSADRLQVIGIALEPQEDAQAWLNGHPVDYPVLIGKQGKADESVAFGNRSQVLPFTVLLDANRRVVATQRGEFDSMDELEVFVSLLQD
jgi:hypothetical protein